MNIEVKVDGKVVYSDRTFKLGEAFDLLQIALTEGQIPEGKVTSVTLRNEGPFPEQIIEGSITHIDGEAVFKRADQDDGVVYPDDEVVEEKPAEEVFMEGQACAV